MTSIPDSDEHNRRRDAMAVLAYADASAIAALVDPLEAPAHHDLRAPECGLVMLRGRVGGDGAPFNLGEATISRAAVRLASGEVGFGYTLGRDTRKARLIALCDAMMQAADYAETIEARVLAPLRDHERARREEGAAETAATRVDFYTLVRGEA
jgi:alpha-D-ribose 1-methylphosphonate 5-triphosphate synthase subunit PhnG